MHSLALVSLLAQQEGGNPIAGFLPLLLIIAVFYLLLIRPQQKKAKQHQQLVRSIGVGDVVVTIGGIHGTVQTLDDDTVRIEIAPGTTITMTRGAIARRLVDADTGIETDMPDTGMGNPDNP
jgi:preprotein translocase subunit YajC